jgi:hypothetical protein
MMNERIEQLAEQTKEFMDGSDDLDIFIEKFAELIVMSVIGDLEKMREEYDNPGMYEPVEYYVRQRAKSVAIDDALDIIQYNFGVKS